MSRARRQRARARPAAPPAPAADAAPAAAAGWRRELLWAAAPVAAALLVHLGALQGAFVYDDSRQIVRNTLIQDPRRFGDALLSDVWAFKGGAGAASNYWRPTFVLWLIANFRLFGLADTLGWHLADLALHAVVVALGYWTSRRLGVSREASAAIALVFAVHPVHCESVAWISGAPDLLLSVALLGALGLAPALANRGTPARWLAALGLYALALGAKEAAILFPVLVWAELSAGPDRPRDARALRTAAPFALLAAAYLLARLAVLGRTMRPYDADLGLPGVLLTAPSLLAFYVLQALLPLRLGPSYPLRAVTGASAGLANLVLPLLLVVAALAGAATLARRSRAARVGLCLFLAPLAPALNVAAFHPEQLVHDRYLYLPLLGLLLVIVPAAEPALAALGLAGARAGRAVLALSTVWAAVLALQTWRYDRAWLSETALWRAGVASDPGSAFNHQQLGAALESEGRRAEARAALDRSIELRPQPNAYVARARVAIAQGSFAEARADLDGLLRGELASGLDPYTRYQAYEALALSHERQRQPERAAEALREARSALPLYGAALTEKLAVVLYQAGRKDEALRELQAYRAAAHGEPLPESRAVLFRIGLLLSEAGRAAEAREAFREFLDATAGLGDRETARQRAQAAAALAAP